MSGPSWANESNAGASPTGGDTPPWLSEPPKVDEEGGEVPIGGATSTTPTSSSSNYSSGVEIDRGQEADSTSDNKRRGGFRLCTIIWYLISLAFFVIFIISAVLQNNDSDGLQWRIFYVLSAILPGLFVIALLCFRSMEACSRPLMAYGFLMLVYSVVYIAISAKAVADAESGGEKKGGDSDNMTDKQEKTLEVIGSTLGLASALYHMIWWKCASRKTNSD